MTLGIDVGGTFTDLVRWDGTTLHAAKTPTTTDQSDGVVDGSIGLSTGEPAALLIHGTTVATNALLERRGARVALVTDPGFEDLLEIGRQDRPSLYDSDVVRPEALVPRSLRSSVLPSRLIDVDVVAVCLLDAYADPAAERRIVAELAESHPGMNVVASSEVSGEFREFERMSTTVLTAYLRPAVGRYLAHLESRVTPAVAERLLVMASSGGLMPPTRAAGQAASILLSGPAGGVVAAAAFGDLLGADAVISFDMGGTSTDVCRIEGGSPEVAYERSIEGFACRLPSVAVHTVGAGGGSVGWVDPGGGLRVGPRSAGAQPGPAAYGHGGTEPTVSDADLVIGRLSAEVPLADGLVLDPTAAEGALRRVGERVGLSVEETAGGIVEIVEAHMERAIRRVSVEQGFDPANAALVAFGGAGGMHASPLASKLGMGRVLVPPHAGVLSALGLLLAPPRFDVARTVLVDPLQDGTLARTAEDLGIEATEQFRSAVGTDPRRIDVSVDMRYVGQSHETSVLYEKGEGPAGLVERFHAVHHQRNGFRRADDPVEVVTVRASAVGRPALTISDLPEHRPSGVAETGRRLVRWGSETFEAREYRRSGLRPGTDIRGPAVVVDTDSVVWLQPADRCWIHESGTLVVDRG